MSYEKMNLFFVLFSTIPPAVFAIFKFIFIYKDDSLGQREKLKQRVKVIISTFFVSIFLLTVSSRFIAVYPFEKDETTTANSTVALTATTNESTTATVTTTKESNAENTDLSHLISDETVPYLQKETIRLMDINGANNHAYYLFDNGKLIFSLHGTCVYPLNKEYSNLNINMYVQLPIKKNTTNKAYLSIKADGKEIASYYIDKDFEKKDISINVSNVDTLTFEYMETGPSLSALGFIMNNPTLIYK